MDRHADRASRKIARAGSEVDLIAQAGGSTNSLGKTANQTPTVVGSTRVALARSRSSTKYNAGGEVNQQTPTALFPRDSDVKSDMRFVLRGVKYEVQNIVALPTHLEASVVSVNE